MEVPTAADGSDYTGVASVVIPAGASSASFNVATLQDVIGEGAENFTVTKMGIDATRPAGRDFAERLVIPEDQRARASTMLAAAGVNI